MAAEGRGARQLPFAAARRPGGWIGDLAGQQRALDGPRPQSFSQQIWTAAAGRVLSRCARLIAP